MKKILIVLSLLLIICAYANAQVPDTSAYLQQIVANKSTYIGKPFSTLEKDLIINIQYFSPFADITYDTNKETSTLFRFIKPQTDEDFSGPILEILWDPYLEISKSETLWNKNDGGVDTRGRFFL